MFFDESGCDSSLIQMEIYGLCIWLNTSNVNLHNRWHLILLNLSTTLAYI